MADHSKKPNTTRDKVGVLADQFVRMAFGQAPDFLGNLLIIGKAAKPGFAYKLNVKFDFIGRRGTLWAR